MSNYPEGADHDSRAPWADDEDVSEPDPDMAYEAYRDRLIEEREGL